MERRCSRCAWWGAELRDEGEAASGTCRRHAPKAAMGSAQPRKVKCFLRSYDLNNPESIKEAIEEAEYEARLDAVRERRELAEANRVVWRWTAPHDWCGEFAQKE